MPAATINSKTLPPGIYCPTITFFQPTAEQNLDVETHVKHMEFLARSGLAGVVVQGSTAEAVTLDDEERKTVRTKTMFPRWYNWLFGQLIRTAKEAFKRCGNNGPVIAGTVGAQSSRQALKLCQDAAEAGADFALVLPPSYYPGVMSANAIQSFFEEVSPVTRSLRMYSRASWLNPRPSRSLPALLLFRSLFTPTPEFAAESTWTPT